MTIKELENRTGMTRANIRFYEGEGLLHPKRLENGYRDYSEEDVRTLEKIKLLRQLQMDLDTIRLVQQGGLTLEQALFSQLTRLEGDKTVLERAVQVCRELEQSGVEYGALEPAPWLRQLSEPERIKLQPPAPKPPVRQEPHDDVPRACYHPWRRLFARGLDMMLYETVFQLGWMLILHDSSIVTTNPLLRWILGLLTLAFTLAAEPFWLHYWGWTPGKWVFGLKIRDEDGNKLTLAQGWQRCKDLSWGGYCWNIPILNLIVGWKCLCQGLDGQDCAWDRENGYRYTREEQRVHGGAIYLTVLAVCAGLVVVGMLWTCMPVNRGNLTVAEFAQNYNQYYRRLLGQGFESFVPEMDRDGQWEWTGQFGGLIAHSSDMTITMSGGEVYHIENPVAGTEVWDPPEFTVSDGRVTAVTLRMTTQDSVVDSWWTGQYRETLALLAMSGAVDGLNPFNYNLTSWAAGPDGDRPAWEDWETDFRGLHISQQVAYSGYALEDAFGGQMLICPDEDTPCRCEKAVTISLIE